MKTNIIVIVRDDEGNEYPPFEAEEGKVPNE
jgi:hypothetical protein